MNNHFSNSTNEEKDLGVIVDDSLKFHRHMDAAVKKANSAVGVIKKSSTTLDTTTLPLLYKSVVRPHLEYWNIYGGPHYKGDQVIVEKVQKRATKLVSSIWHLPYKQRLKALKLPSLMHRRRGDMLETYKVVTNKQMSISHFFEFSFAPTN